MKGRIKRSISLVLSTVIAFSMFVAGTCVASAANDDWKLGCYGLEGDFWTGYSGSLYLYSDDVEYNEDIISAKSSNTKVAKITKEIDVDTYLYFLECKKAGKTTITVKFRTPDGDKTLKKTITVKKYPNEFKSLKVNGKKVNIKKNKFYYNCTTSKKTVSIKGVLKKGWKIRKIEAKRYDKYANESNVKITKKMITKGSSIKFPKKYQELYVNVYLYKGKSKINYEMIIGR